MKIIKDFDKIELKGIEDLKAFDEVVREYYDLDKEVNE